MFSRLITMLLFTWSVYMAVFGQHIFGRERIIEMAQSFKPEITKETELLSHDTTRFFANIAPSAGEKQSKDESFTFIVIDSLTPEDTVSFLTNETDKNEKIEDKKSS